MFVELEVRGASHTISEAAGDGPLTPQPHVIRPVFDVAILQDHRLRGALEKDLLWKSVGEQLQTGTPHGKQFRQ